MDIKTKQIQRVIVRPCRPINLKTCTSYNTVSTDMNLNFMYKFIKFHAVNKTHLNCKYQPVNAV